ncbi:MAG: uL15 family ribosomal protein [Patescibacteria group bacterium]
MQLHQLKRKNPNKKSPRVGRGGKRGKTSGRGGKGQTARAGHKVRPEMRDTIKKLPKRRGYGKNRARTVYTDRPRPVIVNVDVLERLYKDGETVVAATLFEKGAIRRKGGRIPSVKILGNGALTKKLSIFGCAVSAEAQKKIEAVGGTIKQ